MAFVKACVGAGACVGWAAAAVVGFSPTVGIVVGVVCGAGLGWLKVSKSSSTK